MGADAGHVAENVPREDSESTQARNAILTSPVPLSIIKASIGRNM